MDKYNINSARTGSLTFDTLERLVIDFGEQFSSYNHAECNTLKNTLLDLQGQNRKGLGRVRLPDFYKASLYSHWKFAEKADYLRVIGALDESNTSDPLVIVPNYVQASPNCSDATPLYIVCCRNECEDLMGQVEREIAGPFGS